MSDDEHGEACSPPEQPPADIKRELLWSVTATLGIILLLSVASQFVGIIQQYLTVGVAVVFLAASFLLVDRRGRDPESFGMTSHRLLTGVGWGVVFTCLTVIPFAGGYWIWQTQWHGNTFDPDLDHLVQWAASDRGAPADWGRTPGVWTWTTDHALHVGLRRGTDNFQLELRCKPGCHPESHGPVRLDSSGKTRWTARVSEPSVRAQLTIDTRGAPETTAPTTVGVALTSTQSNPPGPIYRGPTARPVGNSTTFERGFDWLLLWIATQIVLIALPEELFYRGYLQTRCRHWFRQSQSTEDANRPSDSTWPVRDGSQKTRRPAWLGVTPENAATSAIFALGHLCIPVGGQILANRAAVLFPALAFGWLRDRTGYITASVTYHAACNMLVIIAAPLFV